MLDVIELDETVLNSWRSARSDFEIFSRDSVIHFQNLIDARYFMAAITVTCGFDPFSLVFRSQKPSYPVGRWLGAEHEKKASPARSLSGFDHRPILLEPRVDAPIIAIQGGAALRFRRSFRLRSDPCEMEPMSAHLRIRRDEPPRVSSCFDGCVIRWKPPSELVLAAGMELENG
jgi:hypothetical protein